MSKIEFGYCEISLKNEEVKRIAELNAEAFGMDYDGYVNMLLNLKPKYFLMYLDKKVIGCCKVTDLGNGFVRLTNVIIDPSYRGKGFGTKLITELKKEYPKIVLNAYTKKNYEFYKKNKFVLVEKKTKEEILDNVADGKSHDVEGLWKMQYVEKVRRNVVSRLGIFDW